jgi:hypothetical protein
LGRGAKRGRRKDGSKKQLEATKRYADGGARISRGEGQTKQRIKEDAKRKNSDCDEERFKKKK